MRMDQTTNMRFRVALVLVVLSGGGLFGQVQFTYTGDVVSNLSGGLKTGTQYLDNYDLTLMLDLEKHLGWKHTELFFYGLGNQGKNPSATLIGDAQTMSNIEAPSGFKVYEFWLQRSIGNHRVLFGLFDLNSEFDSMDSASLFLNSSHGIGPDFSQSGLNGPSIFPVTSLAIRYAYSSPSNFYLRTALFDGVPGLPEKENGTYVKWDKDEGFLFSAEAGKEADGYKWGLGVWRYTADFDTFDSSDQRSNTGVYLLGEKHLSEDGGLSVFGRIGVADEEVNAVDYYLGCGATWSGVGKRSDDQVGLAFAYAHLGSPYVGSVNQDLDDAELNVEATYFLNINKTIGLQLDFQHILDPGMDPALEDATAVATRLTLSF